jgi:hypothetical protein
MQERERCLTLSGDNASAENVHRAYIQGGYKAVLHWQIRHLEHQSRSQYVSPFLLANLYGQLGQRKKTLALLEDAYRQHSPLLLDIQNNPAFDFLHTDARYRAIIHKISLPPAY